MDLRSLVKWGVVLVLGYFVWTEGWPRLQAFLDRTGTSVAGSALAAGESDPHRCLALARQAVESFGDGAADFTGERDVDAWMRFGGRVQSRIATAEDACGCAGETCDLGRRAMGDLSTLVDRLDAVVRGASGEVFNPARDVEEIHGLLDEAERALP